MKRDLITLHLAPVTLVLACNLLGLSFAQSSCSTEQFRCDNGQCISMYDVCDGNPNCSDKSDETQQLCQNTPCAYGFRCLYGACIDSQLVCNNITNCADASDEIGCRGNPAYPYSNECQSHHFKCDSGECIDGYDLCDGTAECKDGSDETERQCFAIRCSSYAFRCNYGACIDIDKKCNGIKDCFDGSDESSSNCGPGRPTEGDRPPPPPPRPEHPTYPTRPKPPTPATPPPRSCRVPENPPGGTYTVYCLNPPCKPSLYVPEFTSMVVKCGKGVTNSEDGGAAYCSNGAWTSLPKCYKPCDPIYPDGFKPTCIYEGKEVNCNAPANYKTIMTAKCLSYYRPLNHEHAERQKIKYRCQQNGTWTPSFSLQCIPGNHEESYPGIVQPTPNRTVVYNINLVFVVNDEAALRRALAYFFNQHYAELTPTQNNGYPPVAILKNISFQESDLN